MKDKIEHEPPFKTLMTTFTADQKAVVISLIRATIAITAARVHDDALDEAELAVIGITAMDDRAE